MNEENENPEPRISASKGSDARLARLRETLRACIVDEVGALVPWLPRRAHEIVAALCLQEQPLSMTEIVAAVGGSASYAHILIRRLEHARVVQRRRERGVRHDNFSLRGEYPNVVLDAYVQRIRRVTDNNRARCKRALEELRKLGGHDAADVCARPEASSSERRSSVPSTAPRAESARSGERPPRAMRWYH